MKLMNVILSAFLFSGLILVANASLAAVVRVGYFPNITHAPAIIGLKKDFFKKELGSENEIKTFTFTAGPAAVEALFANSIDIAYVGPNPAINAYVKSQGKAVRVISGVSSGGARLIVQGDSKLAVPKDFEGKKIATPQLGNTQDVAAREWLNLAGVRTTTQGGKVQILNMANPDQVSQFKRKEIDAAWTVEPWSSILILEANGKELVNEKNFWPNKKFATALIIVRKDFLDKNPEGVESWLQGHLKTLEWIKKNSKEFKEVLNGEFKVLSGKPINDKVLDSALSQIEFTSDPLQATVLKSAKNAFDLGFLGSKEPDLSQLFDLAILQKLK